ncbi:MAG TPA: hypothetical protein VFE42_10860 [Chloroflexota bacterium]|nr:hypothetical protein [Chloroflexota bacterium]
MSTNDTTRAAAGHAAYLAETRRLVDAQTDALFGMVTTILARAGRHDPAARHASISRQDHTLAVTNDSCSETFTVKGIGDRPDSLDRARLFPTSQARCLVQRSDGSTAEWLLRRDMAGESAPVYAWMLAGSEARVGEPEITDVLRPLLECAGS